MTEPTLPQNLTVCRLFNSAALVKIVVVSVCHGGLLFHRSTSVQSTVSTTALTVADLALGVDSVAVWPESQISIKPEASPNKQEIERRREIVRHFFNDFWMSTDDKPRTFAERLNRAEDHINERLAARGETWQLDATTRKQLGLPPPRIV